jgi:hypothetical protein
VTDTLPRAAVEESLTQADAEVERLKAALSQAQALSRFLRRLDEHLAAGHASEALRSLEANGKMLQSVERFDASAYRDIGSLASELRERVSTAYRDLVTAFPGAVAAAGIELDASSRHPRYTLFDGLIEVRFERARFETRVIPRDGRRAVMGIDLPVVVAHIVRERERLLDRPFDPVATLARLTDAYRTVVEKPGDSAPIKQLISQLAQDKGFRADEFNVDLSRLVRDGHSRGRLRLENTRDAAKGVLLWQLDQRGYYGYLAVEGGVHDRGDSGSSHG